MADVLKFGSVVRSRCGRDRKRVFLVVGIDLSDENAPVFVADGKLRRVDRPKKKNPRHLLLIDEIAENEKNALKSGMTDSIVVQIVEKYDPLCKH